MKSRQLGSMWIHRIAEIERLSISGSAFFANATPELFARGREWLDDRFIAPDADAIMLSFQSFLIQAGGLNILVDACHGNDKRRVGALSYCSGLKTGYLDQLASFGVCPADIDIVLCTHLHYDHVGWNTRLDNGRWVPTFPNARYLMSKADFDHFAQAPETDGSGDHAAGSFFDSVLPVYAAGQCDFVSCDHVIQSGPARSLWLEDAAGHSPGSVMLRAASAGAEALFAADVIHHPLQIMEPDLYASGEYDSPRATAVRRRVIEREADRDCLILAAHFPAPTAGRIVASSGGFRFEFDHG